MISQINQTNQMNFNTNFSFDDITRKNKYFFICNNIYDILALFEEIFKKNENIKLLEKGNELALIINVPNPFSPQIEFKIKQNKKYFNDSINELYKIINNQNNEINYLKKVIEEQQIKIENQGNQIQKLDEKLKLIEVGDKYTSTLNENSQIIMKDIIKEKKIIEWINPNKRISFTLLPYFSLSALYIEQREMDLVQMIFIKIVIIKDQL